MGVDLGGALGVSLCLQLLLLVGRPHCWPSPFGEHLGGSSAPPQLCHTAVLGDILGGFPLCVPQGPPQALRGDPSQVWGRRWPRVGVPKPGQGAATCSVLWLWPPLLVLGAFPLFYPLLCNSRAKLFLAGKIWGGGGSAVWGGLRISPKPSSPNRGVFPCPPPQTPTPPSHGARSGGDGDKKILKNPQIWLTFEWRRTNRRCRPGCHRCATPGVPVTPLLVTPVVLVTPLLVAPPPLPLPPVGTSLAWAAAGGIDASRPRDPHTCLVTSLQPR